MPTNPCDPERAKLVNNLRKKATIAALDAVLKEGIKWNDQALIKDTADAIELVAGNKNPITVTRPTNCTKEDCEGCFFKWVCEAEEHFKLMQETQRVINEALLREATLKMREDAQPKKMTLGADTLAKAKADEEESGRDLTRKADLVMKELSMRYDGTLTPQLEAAFDKALGRKPKATKIKSMTMTGDDDANQNA